MSPSFWSIFGSSTASPAGADVEAQRSSSTQREMSFEIQSQLPSPARAYTHNRSRAADEDGTDPIDDFFGTACSPQIRTCGSPHHDTVHFPAPEDVPPPYAPRECPPVYTRVEEHPTLAQYLFLYGFLFPLFWVAGACILFSPLSAPEDWEVSKTEAQRQDLIRAMREVEVRWARRSLAALLALAVVVAVVVIAVVTMHRA